MRTTYRRPVAVLAVLGLAVLALAGCGGRQSAAPGNGTAAGAGCEVAADTRLSIATGNTGGVYYVLGGRLGELVTEATGGKLKATAAETGASVQDRKSTRLNSSH